MLKKLEINFLSALSPQTQMSKKKFSIGVVTYINRFEKYFIPLVKQLERLFPDVQKNYVLNGYYDQGKQQEYLKKAKGFLSQTSASTVLSFDEHHGLTHCWNQLVLNSQAEKVLVLNDDLVLSRLFVWFLNAQINFYDSAVINKSWSHFFISKSTIKKVGWFDERFIGMGSEDADYALRMALAEGKTEMPHSYLHSIYCLGVKNIIAHDTDPGWKNISGFSQGKYAKVNYDFFHEKWDVSKTFKPGYIHGFNFGYYLQKPDMQTPLFYPLEILDKTR